VDEENLWAVSHRSIRLLAWKLLFIKTNISEDTILVGGNPEG
jgi:hypothetical protein